MSDATIIRGYVYDYKTNIELLLQQRGSKLRGTVTEDTYQGKAGRPVEHIGPTNARQRVSKYEPMPFMQTPHDTRWVYPKDFDWADLIDKMDKLRLLTDPTSAYAVNGTYAMGRAMDDQIIGAFFSPAKTGDEGGTNTAFPATQQVGVDVGASGATGLNVEKLREGKKLLMAAEVDLDMEPIVMGITAEQHDDLLSLVQVVSTDFNDRPVLVDGRVQRFLGINFIHIERLETDPSGYRRCPMWVPSGMHLGIWNEIEADLDRRADLAGKPWQISLDGTFGATRLMEEKVVEVKCDES